MNQFDIDLRNEWRQLSTLELEAKLQAELEKTPPDDDIVLLLLHILEEREPDDPLQLTPGEQAAFERYKQSMTSRSKRRRPSVPRWLSVAACGVLILGLLISVLPQEAEAETFWEMLQRWSDSILEILNPREHISSLDYQFETDNPGLQQVYDAVVELGVTEPVVPMWLPDSSELTELTLKQTPMLKSVCASFLSGEKEIIYKLDLYDGEPAHQYYKDDVHYESYEKNGTVFNITKNLDEWVVVWTNDNIECFITLDCQEETLRRILESIYVMEE